MASFNPYTSAAATHKYNERKDYQKPKTFQNRCSDRSLFKFQILDSCKRAQVFSCAGETIVDLIKEENDLIALKDRVSLKFEDLFTLQILIPDMLVAMERGEPNSYVVNDKNNIYLMSSKLPKNIGRGVIRMNMLANIRQKYFKKEENKLTEGVSDYFFLSSYFKKKKKKYQKIS